MITFHWLILRLFWSLLLLPLAAYPLLWLLHEVAFPGVYFPDGFIVVVLWGLLFALTSFILSRIGARRFAQLDEAGRQALAANQEEQLKEVFSFMQSLFAGGLLSRRFQEKMQRQLLRHYFPFYAVHPENARYREQLLSALSLGIHAKDSYEALKAYVIQQPALTLPAIDLAEELLEHQPDDDLLAFLARHYLQERKTHYRAEHIYTQYLAGDGPMAPEILALCRDKFLRLQRQDDFAVWTFVRACEYGDNENSSIRRMLYQAQQNYQRLRRRDALANAVTTIVSTFTEDEIAEWRVEQQAEQTKKLQFRVARVFFHLQQWLLEIYSRLRERRKLAYVVASGILVLVAVYLVVTSGNFNTQKVSAVETEPAEDPNAVYFALQVAALRKASTAQREAERLQQHGLEAHVLEPETSRGWHRVRVGKYRSRRAAQAAADSLKAVGIIRDYFVANYEKR